MNFSEQLVGVILRAYKSRQHVMSYDLEKAASYINSELDNLTSYIQLGDHFFEDLLADDPASEEIKFMYSKLGENARMDLAMRSGEFQNLMRAGPADNSLSDFRQLLSADEMQRLVFYLRNDQVIQTFCSPGELQRNLEQARNQQASAISIEDLILNVKREGFDRLIGNLKQLIISASILFSAYHRLMKNIKLDGLVLLEKDKQSERSLAPTEITAVEKKQHTKKIQKI